MTAQEVQQPLSTFRQRVPGKRIGARAGAAVVAMALVVAGMCAGDARAGFFPFGAATRGVSDLGNQYVPFYAYLWDVLHGQARGDLFVNWASGLGSSYLPDLFYYLAGPFSLLVGAFRRDQVDLAVYVITVAKIACGAGAMAWYLRSLPSRTRPRSGLAAVFGAAYGLCGWAVTDATYNPMWLDGLIAFPLLCLSVEWALARRRPVLGTLCVAFAWACDFYTAYFAVIGAAALLVIRLAAEPSSWRDRLGACGRVALRTAVGTGLAAPAFLVVYFAAQDAWPVAPRPFHPLHAVPLAGRLLPGSYQFNSPALFVGTFALFAALTLPFNRALPVRVRVAWTAVVAAVLASMLWAPAVRVWYAFTSPNGSAYREAFVLCGLLVAAGWTSFSRGVPRPPALAAAGVLLGGTVWAASRWRFATPEMTRWVAICAVAGAVLYGLLTLARRLRGRRLRYGLSVALLAALAAVQTAEAAANVAQVDVKRLAHLDDYPAWGPWHQRLRTVVTSADGWPSYRTDPGERRVSANDPQLVGGEGAAYYSSMTSTVLVDMLYHLGFGWTSRGRAPRSLDNPVTDAVLAIGARARTVVPLGFTGDTPLVTLSRALAAPLVTVRPPSPAPPAYGPSPFRNQELLLGAQVYDLPEIRYERDTGAELQGDRHGGLWTVPDAIPSPSYPYVLRADCRPGEQVYFNAPEFSGMVTLAGNDPVSFELRTRHNRAPVERLGTVPATGRLKVKLRPHLPGRVPGHAIGCLDTTRLDAAVRSLRAAGATAVHVSGHTVSATLPAGGTGTAVLAIPAIRGWTCSLGGGDRRPPERFLGLLAVPLDGRATSLTCSFTPPGLGAGLAVAGASLLAGLASLLLSRRRGRPPFRRC
ncbi:YfhO family protein [Sphaerisporangium fuscum]|uniref:YfhO family protein n=1 Tax=Sphaerisporangium fuscum TaxID=2835868 RepID=UPI001BDCB732|nr:YfhO family protein [Sphaerisporangium fuscum]